MVGNGSLNSSILYKIYFLTWGSLCLYVVSHGGSMSGSIILLTWTVEIKKKNGDLHSSFNREGYGPFY